MPPDRWLVLTVSLPSETPEGETWESIPEFLLSLGGGGVQETREGFTTYLLPPPELDGFLARVREGLNRIVPGAPEVRWSWQPHEDWEHLWRKGLGPRRVTPRITVAPSWDLPSVPEEEILICLDPGMAFGTAEHATTRGCLRLLDGRVREGDRVADIGAGSGILSIAAVRLGAVEVLAVEVDPMACQAARENLEANGVAERVNLLTREVRAGDPLAGAPFQGIVSNIQPFVLEPLLPTFRESLVSGGWLILSGLLLEEKDELLASARAEGFVLEDEDWEETWWSGAFLLSGTEDQVGASRPR